MIRYKNRKDAAKQLITVLARYRGQDVVVMAIPRGGVPVASEIAQHYGWKLDLIFTKKIGHPSNPELAIGSVSLHEEMIDSRFSVDPDWLKEEIRQVRLKLQAKQDLFMESRNSAKVTGKKVLIVDDGMATGNTMAIAIEDIRQLHAEEVIVVVPVASFEAAQYIKSKVDALICLQTPHNFVSVGQFYEEFPQISDEEVQHIMQNAGNSVK